MNFQETQAAFDKVRTEIGLQAELVTDKAFANLTGAHIDDAAYKVVNGDKPTSVVIKWRGKTPKVITRAIWMAIGELLWPSLAHDKIVWYGIVMSQPDDLPKRVVVPEGAKTRSALLKLTIAQAKRKAS